MFGGTFRFWVVWSIAIEVLCTLFLTSPLQAQATTQTLNLPLLQTTSSMSLGIGLSNPTSSTATITLTARSYDGTVISGSQMTNPATVRIPANSQQAFLAADAFGSGIVGRTG